MQDTLILRVKNISDLNACEWFLTSEDPIQVNSGNVASLPKEDTKGKKVIVLIPPQEVLLTHVKLPKLKIHKMLSAIPYALEDHLIDDVNHLHFAIPDKKDMSNQQGDVGVAIIALTKMKMLCDELKKVNIQADAFVSEFFLVPTDYDSVQVTLVENLILIRTDTFAGYLVDDLNRDNLFHYLENEFPSKKIIIINNYTLKSIFAENTQKAKEINEVMKLSQHYLSDNISNLEKYPYINLLQGKFTAKNTQFPHVKKLWGVAIGLIALWVVLIFSDPTISYFLLKEKHTALNREINQIYKKNFPNAVGIVAPKTRMEDKLKKLTSNSGEEQLFIWLSKITQSLNAVAGVKLNKIIYQNHELAIDVSAISSDTLSNIIETMNQYQLKVKQQNANLEGDQMNATLTIN